MNPLYLASMEEESDPQHWDVSTLSDPLTLLAGAGFRTAELTIAPLKAGWTTPLPEGWYRSGAGPLEALRDGARAVGSGVFDAVLIKGEERMRTGYDREERHRLMDIYGGVAIPECYELLARAFCASRGWLEADFLKVAAALFENYAETAAACSPEGWCAPPEKWYRPLTPLQRGVDCANPLIDWRGMILLLNGRAAASPASPGGPHVRLAGIGHRKLPVDGPDHVERIARFDHLRDAIAQAEGGAGFRIAKLAHAGDLAMELYTCYPVIPAAFLAASSIAETPEDAVAFLSTHPVTLTGGMNLARAPWNLPALRALVRVGRAVAAGEQPCGLVHANGGVGYAQGVALLAPV